MRPCEIERSINPSTAPRSCTSGRSSSTRLPERALRRRCAAYPEGLFDASLVVFVKFNGFSLAQLRVIDLPAKALDAFQLQVVEIIEELHLVRIFHFVSELDFVDACRPRASRALSCRQYRVPFLRRAVRLFVDELAHVNAVVLVFHMNAVREPPELLLADEVIAHLRAGESRQFTCCALA